MLAEIQALLTDDDECEGTICIRTIHWPEKGCEVVVGVRPANGSEVTHAYRLACAEALEVSFTCASCASNVELLDTHPLLISRQRYHDTIAFKGRVDDPRAAMQEVREAHDAYHQGWRLMSLGVYEHASATLGHHAGIFGSAPADLADIYKAILERHGTEAYFFPDRPRGRPAKLPLEGEMMPGLLTLGDNWVIGTAFTIDRVPLERLG